MRNKLFKYCRFSTWALRAITEPEVHYTKPTAFNDPLDCNPTIVNDGLGCDDIERIHFRLLRRQGLDKEAASKRMNSIRRSMSEYGDRREVGSEAEREFLWTHQYSITESLRKLIERHGVLPLSAKWDSVLMWSHYADEHRGVCIEYDTSDQDHPRLKPVNYGASRSIKMSDLFQWLVKGSADAQSAVIDTALYAKSSQWRYEREWRDVRDESGPVELPFRITGIHFGFRCDSAVVTSIVKLLSDDRKIKLWQVEPKKERFDLRRYPVDRDDIEANGVRTPFHLMLREFFSETDDFPEVDED